MVKRGTSKSKSIHNRDDDVVKNCTKYHSISRDNVNFNMSDNKSDENAGSVLVTPTTTAATAMCIRPSLIKTTMVIAMIPSGPDWINRQLDEEILSLPCWTSYCEDSQRQQQRQHLDQEDNHHDDNNDNDIEAVSFQIVSPREEMAALLERRAWFRSRCKSAMDMTMILILASLFILIPCNVPHAWLMYYCSGSWMIMIGLVGYGAHLWISQQLKSKFVHALSGPSNNNNNHEQKEQDGFHHRIQVSIQKKDSSSWLKRQTKEEILSIKGWTQDNLVVLRSLLQRKRTLWITIYAILILAFVMESMEIFCQSFSTQLWAMGHGIAGSFYRSFFGGFLPLMAIVLWFMVAWLDHSVYELFSNRFERKKSSSSRSWTRRRRTAEPLPTVHEEDEEMV